MSNPIVKALLAVAAATALMLPMGCAALSALSSVSQPPETTGTGNEPSRSARLPESSTVRSAQETSQIAGYTVLTPAFIPEGFQHTEWFVLTKMSTANGTAYSVSQTWTSKNDPTIAFSLLQDPVLAGIGGGEPSEVAGVPGQRKFTPAGSDGSGAHLSLYWRDSDMAYLVTGALQGSLTEDELQRIAASVVQR